MKHPVRTRACLLGSVLLLLATSLISQSRPIRTFETQSYQKRLYDSIPEVKEQSDRIEEYIRFKQNEIESQDFTIGVVFHVIQGPQSPRISKADIREQLATLNQDFSREGVIRHEADTLEGFVDRSSKMQITFCFPQADPDGKLLEDAIFFHQSESLNWTISNAIKSEELGGTSPWDPDRFLNIWITDLKDNKAGFAQMPGGPPATDGIVIDYDFFGNKEEGRPYGQGKTLTHLIGSYLGLRELWNFDNPCADDGVDDTPIHNLPNHGTYDYRHVTLCDQSFPTEMTMNFMDASDDEEQYMFTRGQKFRVQAILSAEGPRGGLNATEIQCETPELLSLSGDLKENISKNRKIAAKIFPNPADDSFVLNVETSESTPGRLLVYDSQGRIVLNDRIPFYNGHSTLRLNSSSWLPGNYVVLLVQGDSRLQKVLTITRN